MDKDMYDKGFSDTLSQDQLNKYKKIVEERKKLSMQGYALGFGLAVVLIVLNMTMKKQKLSKGSMACTTAATMFIVQYLYYILSPKSDWILLHLNTQEQKEKWLDVYRTMQYNCHVSVALGVVAAAALSHGFC
jgi:heme/copper-type cytochrome/quinol oxidase subunit 4|tara:strand:+ start:856 stop:1254 length:399 start_codon:yes stop_codon:yes gene_type:complete